MTIPIGTHVVGKDGLRGQVTGHLQADTTTQVTAVLFDDTTVVHIPTTMLVEQADGSVFVPLGREDLTHSENAQRDGYSVLPIIAEEIHIEKRTVERGRVQVRKVIHAHDEIVDEPLLREHVEVTRVAINRQIDAPPQVRHEGTTLIIPVVEEILVVEKRLILKEELHIIRHQTTMHDQQTVTLRREAVIVTHMPPADAREDPQQA